MSGCTLAGYKVTGKGDYANNSIFLPAAGYFNNWYSEVEDAGIFGHFFSSTPGNEEYYAFRLGFSSSSQFVQYINREYGFSVRAVLK